MAAAVAEVVVVVHAKEVESDDLTTLDSDDGCNYSTISCL